MFFFFQGLQSVSAALPTVTKSIASVMNEEISLAEISASIA